MRATKVRAAGIDRLTSRELQILQLISDGFTSPEIAYFLGISVKTVHVHKSNIFAKLECHSVAEAVAIAVRAGRIG